jgi:S1-C subfamily serine protease
VPRLISGGKFERPTLGVQVAPLEFQGKRGVDKGVAVIGVLPRSGAAAAGIKPFQREGGDRVVGDVIVAVGGKTVTTLDEILDVLEQHKPGDTITLSLKRAGNDKPEDVQVKLGATEQ